MSKVEFNQMGLLGEFVIKFYDANTVASISSTLTLERAEWRWLYLVHLADTLYLQDETPAGSHLQGALLEQIDRYVQGVLAHYPNLDIYPSDDWEEIPEPIQGKVAIVPERPRGTAFRFSVLRAQSEMPLITPSLPSKFHKEQLALENLILLRHVLEGAGTLFMTRVERAVHQHSLILSVAALVKYYQNNPDAYRNVSRLPEGPLHVLFITAMRAGMPTPSWTAKLLEEQHSRMAKLLQEYEAQTWASTGKRLTQWLESHDTNLVRFEHPVPLSEVSREVGEPVDRIVSVLGEGNVLVSHIWEHEYRRGRKSRSKPYLLHLSSPDAVCLDWEDSVVGAVETEFQRRGYETQRQLGTSEHLTQLIRAASLAPLAPGHNLRDLWALRRNAKDIDLWILEVKGKEAYDFDSYCLAEAL